MVSSATAKPRSASAAADKAALPAAIAAAGKARLHQAAIDGSPDAFIVVDENGRIVEWGASAATMFGWPAAEILGRFLAETAIPVAGNEHIADLIALRPGRSGAPAGGRRRVNARRRDGDAFTAEIQTTPVDIDGRRYVTAFIRDISDTLLAEQQLVQAQKLEAIGHLTGGLAHDFNNLLGIIIGSLDLIEPGGGKEERELLAAALAAAHRGADITRALLAVARRRALKPQPTDVNAQVNELAPLLRQSAGKRLTVDISANAINALSSIDAGGLNNALVNLVINARDAMPAGGRILVYTYTTEIQPLALTAPLELKPGPYIVVGVDDNGSGMPPEVAMRAFDPFFTTKERGQGTGLGLAMVYGFARQSGGTARIQSAPGRGTSVQILLPALAAAATLPPAGGEDAAPAGNAQILVVDDEAPLLHVAREWLRGLGHAVSTAASADEALAQLAERRFDLLVADIVMPGSMDGLALLERCRRLYPEMPALLTTGFADNVGAALSSGFRVLDKPYTRRTLGQAVADALLARPVAAG